MIALRSVHGLCEPLPEADRERAPLVIVVRRDSTLLL